MNLTVVFVVVSVASFAAVAAVRPVLVRASVLDVPNERSSHRDVVPRGAGVAVLFVIVATFVVADLVDRRIPGWVYLAVLGSGVLGFFDDLFSLTARTRLVVQVGVGGVVAWGALGPDWSSLALAAPAVVWMIAFTNAYNFMDGINGVAGLTGVAAGSWYWVLGVFHEDSIVSTTGCVVAAAALGFLPWNAPRARVFLGDAGSYALGSALALLAIECLVNGYGVVLAFAPLYIYLVDTGLTLIGRVRRGQSMMDAHRDHVYQRLSDHVGHSAAAIAVVLCSSVVMAMSVIWAREESAPLRAVSGLVVVLVTVFYVGLPVLAPRTRAG